MKRSIAIIATLVGISLVAHVAIAQLGGPLPQTHVPGSWGKVPPAPFKCKELACLQSTPKGDIVHVKGKKTFVVVSRFGKEVVDAQIVYGPRGAVAFTESAKQGATFDVFELKALGSVGVEGFKPCYPRPDSPTNPDCIPTDFPPRTSQWFTRYFKNLTTP